MERRKLQVLVRMWSNQNPWALLVEMEDGAASTENSMAVSQKARNMLIIRPSG